MRLSVLFLFCLLANAFSTSAQTQQSAYGFLSLNARNEKQHAVINWETIQELTTTHFNIQQSINGYDFTTIGSIEAIHDTSVSAHQYSFMDPNAANRSKLVYYRLEIGINNGRALYSKSFLVRFDDAAEERLSFSPNVVSSILPMSLETRYQGMAHLQIIDPQGRILYTENLQLQSGSLYRSIDVSRLPQGQYVAVVFADGLRLQQRFFHQ
jgi:hypothetical protein